MATQNNVNINVTVDDNGTTEKLDQKAQKTHKTMKDMVKTAASIVFPSMPAGAAKVANAAQPTGSSRLMSEVEYNAARGTAGVTGASARDFAKQAEGLSGLVRLYAVYAANVYAAGAAFTALSNAMDTANMVKGLDQLGAASGRALGSLAKDFVAATGGAVSLRDSMEAVAKASSSGMSSTQIIRMGKAADQASKALGVNMQDAVSRITRGITKLEPELLDELGIFIRIDDVTKEYAKSVNKAAGELTDFERRQAVANAVLDQAEKKFSAIDIDTNPYTKLAATLQNVSQSALELANKVLGPLVDYLSSSPNTLALGMAALGTIIVKQAIPAIAQFRESIVESSREAVKASVTRLNAVSSAIEKEAAIEKAAADVNAELASNRFEKVQLEIEKKYSESTKRAKKFAKEMQDILALPVSEIVSDPAKMATVEKYASKGDPTKGVSKDYNEAYKALLWYKAEEQDYVQKSKEIEQDLLDKKAAANQKYAKEKLGYIQDIAKSEITTNAALSTSTRGLSFAFAELLDNVSKARKGLQTVSIEIDEVDKNGKKTTKTITEMVPKVSLLGAASMLAGGAFAVLGSALMGAFQKLAPYLEIFGIVTVALGAFDAFMSSATKAISNFEEAIDRSDKSLDNLDKTLDAIYRKDPSEFFNVESLLAQSNAIQELSDSLKTLGVATEKALAEVSKYTYDSIKNSIYSFFGGGVEKNFQKQLFDIVTNSVEGIESGPLKTEFASKISSILDVENISDIPRLKAALKDVLPGTEKFKQLQKEILGIANATSIAASRSKEFADSIKKTADAYKNFADKYKIKDELALLALGQYDELVKLQQLLDGPVEAAVSGVVSLLSDTDAVSIFGAAVPDVLKYKDSVTALNKTLGEQEEKLKAIQQGREKIKKSAEYRGIETAKAALEITPEGEEQSPIQKKEIAKLEARLAAFSPALTKLDAQQVAVEAGLKVTKSELQKITAEVAAKIPKALATQVGYIENGIVAALAKGSTQFMQTVLGAAAEALGDPELIRQQTQLKIAELASEKTLIQTNLDLIAQLDINAAEAALQTAAIEKATLAAKPPGTVSLREIDLANEKFAKAEEKVSLTRLAKTDPRAAAAKIKGGTELDQAENKKILELAMRSAGAIADMNRISQAIKTEKFQGQLKEIDVAISGGERRLSQERDILKAKRDQLEEDKLSGKISQEVYNSNTLILDTDSARLQYTQDILKASQVYSKQIAIAANVSDSELRTRLISEAESNFIKSKNLAADAEALAISKGIRKDKEGSQAIAMRELEVNQELTKLTKDAADIRRDTDLERLNNLYKIAEVSGTLGPAEAKNAQLVLDIERNRQETSQKLADLNFNYTQKREKDLLALKAVTDEQEKARRAELMKAEDALYIAQTSNISAVGKLRQDELQQQISGIASLTDALTNLADSLKGISDSLGENVFGNFAKGLSDTLTSLTSLLTKNEENTKAIEKFGQTASDAFDLAREAPDMESYNKYIAEGNKALELKAKAEEKAQKDELKGYTQTANAAKKMFKEKTAAYKVFNAIEKTSQAMSLALELKTAAVKIATWMGLIPAKVTAEAGVTAAEAGGAAARAPVTYGEIIGNYLSKIPAPFGMVAGVAAGAFFLSLLGKGGGSKSAFVPTAEQRQETQGTAMGWDSEGNKVQVRRGVFGDTDAKSESIANSLELIQATSVEGLSYYDRMLSALRGIEDSLTGAAEGLFGVRGLRTGSLSGVSEGTNTSGGLLGIGGLFSSSTTKSILDSGLALKGTFAELAAAATGVIKGFEVIQTVKSSSGFFGIGGSTKTRINTVLSELPPEAVRSVSQAFVYGEELLRTIGDTAGVAQDTITTVLQNLDVDELVSLRGLTGEELTKELSSVIGSILDDASYEIFESFAEYAKFGEGMLETVVRVLDSNRKAIQALDNMGISFTLVGDASFAVTEGLVNAAGGLDKFLEQASFFTENFMDEAAQLAPAQKSVAKTFADLGLTVPKSRHEFALLVKSLDLTDSSTHSMYQTLMDVAPAFDKVSDAAEEALETLKSGLEDTISKLQDFILSLEKFRTGLLLGSQSTLSPIEKYIKAQSEFETTFANLSSSDAKVVAEARSSITGAASAYLEASKTYFASSGAYTADFNYVVNKLGDAQAVATDELSVAEQQLAAAKAQTQLLTNIDLGISTLASIPTTSIGAAATGGWRQGLTLVGELGPEIVDFKTPGQVYTANQTAGMFAPNLNAANQQAIVQELKALRAEVSQLRKDQQQQTGDLIMSTYDSNQKASEKVAETIVATNADSAWQDRSKVVIK